jgi:hypothetical protein
MDPANIDQQREISAVRWLPFDEANAVIRAYNIEKKQVLVAADACVREKHIRKAEE